MYTVAKEAFISGNLDLVNDTIQCRLVEDDYTYSAAHTSMTPVTKVTGSTDQTLASKTVTDGIFDAADPTYTAVPGGGDAVTGVVIFKFVTNDAGSTPIVYLELVDVTTNGSDITVNFDTGANKVFAI